MQIANVKGRLSTFVAGELIDVEAASDGRFSSAVDAIYPRWQEFTQWGGTIGAHGAGEVPDALLGAPSPSPSQVFAIGVNYRDHASEAEVPVADSPVVFTKFPSCLTGPASPVAVIGDTTDWEIELVVVLGRRAHRVSRADAWAYVAGVSVGQDLSERTMQTAGPIPQFSLGKSYPGFGPIGPFLVTCDELERRDDLALVCTLDGETVQKARTSSMIFPVDVLIEALSAVCPLAPGDVIFTGTPAGVGIGRVPATYLRPGQQLISTIEGVGTLTTNLT